MAKFLEEKYGWTVHDEKRVCKCGQPSYDKDDKFCRKCGKKLGKVRPHQGSIDQIETAMAYALGEAILQGSLK
jgi:ribosomal protein L37E